MRLSDSFSLRRLNSHYARWCALLVVALWAPADVRAQAPQADAEAPAATSGPLYEELARLDSLAFDASFVSCDAEAANALFADDVEFYHDLTGAQFGDEVRENTRRLAGSCPGDQGVTRVLVDGTLEVYPIHDYGAVQTGTHRFVERGAPTSTVAQFVHLWRRQPDGPWRLARVLSYDHRTERASAWGAAPPEPAPAVTATPGTGPPPPDLDGLRVLLDRRVPELLREHGVPSASYALVRGGEVVLSGTYGEQADGVPASDRTLYQAASLTKPVAAEVVLRLASAGVLSLDEPYAPDWTDPDLGDDPRHGALTPRVSLTHRTGFANWRDHTGGVLRFDRDPDTETGYSGEGFDYLVRFVEARTERPFDEVAAEVLFGPAGMASTSFTQTGADRDRLAWTFWPDSTWHEPVTTTTASGANNLRTTAVDYARFLATTMRGDGVSADLRLQRTEIAHDLSDEACPGGVRRGAVCPPAQGFGLSWYVEGYPDETVVSHSGANTGAKSLAFYVPEADLAVAVFANGENGFEVVGPVVRMLTGLHAWVQMYDSGP